MSITLLFDQYLLLCLFRIEIVDLIKLKEKKNENDNKIAFPHFVKEIRSFYVAWIAWNIDFETIHWMNFYGFYQNADKREKLIDTFMNNGDFHTEFYQS